MLVWSFMHIKWYWVPVEIFLIGGLAGKLVERFLGSILCYVLAWIPMLIIAVYAWFFFVPSKA